MQYLCFCWSVGCSQDMLQESCIKWSGICSSAVHFCSLQPLFAVPSFQNLVRKAALCWHEPREKHLHVKKLYLQNKGMGAVVAKADSPMLLIGQLLAASL